MTLQIMIIYKEYFFQKLSEILSALAWFVFVLFGCFPPGKRGPCLQNCKSSPGTTVRDGPWAPPAVPRESRRAESAETGGVGRRLDATTPLLPLPPFLHVPQGHLSSSPSATPAPSPPSPFTRPSGQQLRWCRRRRRGGPTSGGHGSPLQEGPEICDATDHYVRGKMWVFLDAIFCSSISWN